MAKQKLMTKEIEKVIPAIYAQDGVPAAEKTVYVKFFTPYSNWTWYATEYDPETKQFFGLVDGFELEWGYFSLEEFEQINAKSYVPKIERDMYFGTKKIGEIRELQGRLR